MQQLVWYINYINPTDQWSKPFAFCILHLTDILYNTILQSLFDQNQFYLPCKFTQTTNLLWQERDIYYNHTIAFSYNDTTFLFLLLKHTRN